MTDALVSLLLSALTELPPQPRREVIIPPANEDSTPQDKLRGIYYHSQDIKLRLEDYFCKFELMMGREEDSQTETSENTSPAASMPTKMNEIPLTVRWTYISQ
jgi:hypothetical protein